MRYFSKIRHRAALFTLSYAFFKSTIHITNGYLYSVEYYNNCRTLKIWSEHDRPFLKPDYATCNSSSIYLRMRPKRTCAYTFPGMLSRLIPRKLSQKDGSPFLGIAVIRMFFHSCGAFPLSQTNRIMRVNQLTIALPPCFSNSAGMRQQPGAFLFFNLFNAAFTSCSVGGSPLATPDGADGMCTLLEHSALTAEFIVNNS